MNKWKRSESLGNIYKLDNFSFQRCDSQLSNITILPTIRMSNLNFDIKSDHKKSTKKNNTIQPISLSRINKAGKNVKNNISDETIDELDTQSLDQFERINSPFRRPSKPTPPKKMNL
jgi:uncharacterized protein YdgA (DUF945 family)